MSEDYTPYTDTNNNKKSETTPPLHKSHNLKEDSTASSLPQLSYLIRVHE